jgi:hypothetical protein
VVGVPVVGVAVVVACAVVPSVPVVAAVTATPSSPHAANKHAVALATTPKFFQPFHRMSSSSQSGVR